MPRRQEGRDEAEYSWSGPDSLVHDLSARGVRRALTNAPPLAVDAIVAEDADDFVDTLSPVRRARTDLPPLAPSGWSGIWSRGSAMWEPPVRVAFTRELSDARALNRWRATALAMARASQLLKRTDSRIAGCIERAHDAERASRARRVREGGAALLEGFASLRLRGRSGWGTTGTASSGVGTRAVRGSGRASEGEGRLRGAHASASRRVRGILRRRV